MFLYSFMLLNTTIERDKMSDIEWKQWVLKANVAEDRAKHLDRKAHSFPIDTDLFLQAARYSRKSAGFQRLAGQSTGDLLLKSISVSNYHFMIGNAHKSVGNYFYYSLKLSRAVTFFKRASKHFARGVLNIPKELSQYDLLLQDSIEHQIHLKALVANCEGGLAKAEENWKEALVHYRLQKEQYQKLKSLGGDYACSLNLGAALQSAEREIQICRAMISFGSFQFDKALKHAMHAVRAAEKALQEDPDWVYYQEILVSTVSLREAVRHVIDLKKVSDHIRGQVEKLSDKYKSLISNLLSYKFEKEVEYHLRQKHQYPRTQTRYKPPYLGREIDVYASKGERIMIITLCECKLRLDNGPITAHEVEEFVEKARAVHQYEQDKGEKEGRQVKIHLWFVTNTRFAEKAALEVAKINDVAILQAVLPKNFRTNPNWRLSRLKAIETVFD